jgi:glycosyltransferase involved in cell wall biosynthesis
MKLNLSIKVSVVIPTYNSAEKLKECLNALEKQNFPSEKYEIIVIDDGSNDSTAAIVRNFEVNYYYQNNRGPAAARNRGSEMAQGDIILFTDSDCIPDKSWIKQMVSSLQCPEIVGVKGAYISKQRKLWARFAQVEFTERYKLLQENKYIDMVDTYSAGFRKYIFLSMGGFDTSFPVPNNEDTDLSYRMSLKGYKMVFNPNAVVWHSSHPDSMKKYMKLKFWRGYWRMVVYQRYSSKMLKDSYTPQTLKLQILLSFWFGISLALVLVSPLITFYVCLFLVLSFITTCLPFMRLAIHQDTTVGLLSPFFLFIRACSIGSGALYRLLRLIFTRKN